MIKEKIYVQGYIKRFTTTFGDIKLYIPKIRKKSIEYCYCLENIKGEI